MLQTEYKSEIPAPHMRRGHAHKRSAAISGDFDLDFFQKGPSISQALSGDINRTSSSLPSESFMQKKSTSSNSPPPPPPSAPTLVITTPDEEDYRASRSIISSLPRTSEKSSTATPSPKKKHTRLNSWAHSLIKPKQKDPQHTSSSASAKLDYNSSSNDTTPELKRTSVNSNYSYHYPSIKPENYQVPEAIIDLDLASGIHYDPASSIVPTKTKAAFHRRTESAPELEDFFKYKFSSVISSKNSRRNSAIVEEEEDDDEAMSSTSSNNQGVNKNRSVNSLNSCTSSANGVGARVQSPSTYQSLTSTPTSAKTRRGGASAARYQSYYNNNILLANALKSSESLSQVTGTGGTSSLHKTSYSSFQTQKSTLAAPTSLPHSVSSSSASSLNSNIQNSPSRFKFESQVYDMPAGQYPGYASESNTTPKAKSSSTATTTSSPSKRSVGKSTKSHKKSNSLLNSLSMKIRGGSFSSSKNDSKVDLSTGPDHNSDNAIADDYEEELEADRTLTPFNFGEPGPALDLNTMTPKFYNDDHDFNNNNHHQVLAEQTSPSRVESSKKSKKAGFFSWRRK